jgi:hypothetical protein
VQSRWSAIFDAAIGIPDSVPWRPISNPFQGAGYFAATYDHSVRSADGGMTAYLSYWDAGTLKLDISDPTHPRLVGRTGRPFAQDQDAHSMTPFDVGGTRYILQANEDFDPHSPSVITTSATGDQAYTGIEQILAPTTISDTGRLSGAVFDAGAGCRASDYAGAAGKIVLVDFLDPQAPQPQPCALLHQIITAAQAHPRALVLNFLSIVSPQIFFDRTYTPAQIRHMQRVARGMPVELIASLDDLASRVRAALPQGAVQMTLEPGTPAWGYLRVFSEAAATDSGTGAPVFPQVATFTDAPHAYGELHTPPGFWSIHNVEVRGTMAYASWYSNGIVAIDMHDSLHPRRVGQFIPHPGTRYGNLFGSGFAIDWGVAIDPATGIIYASDMRNGLWIVQPTGPAAS